MQAGTKTDCTCCKRGSILIQTGIAVVFKVGRGYANASNLDGSVYDVLVAQGQDPADINRLWRAQEYNLVYPLYSLEDPEFASTWTKSTIKTHDGRRVVASADQIAFTIVDNSEPVVSPYYVDLNDLQVDESSVVYSSEVTIEEVISFATDRASSSSFGSVEVMAPELNGYHSGVYKSDGEGYAVVQKAWFQPFWIVLDQTLELLIETGSASIPVAWQFYRSGDIIKGDGVFVPFRQAEGYFALVDLGEPSVDWNQVPFDDDGETLYSVEVIESRADIWPVGI